MRSTSIERFLAFSVTYRFRWRWVGKHCDNSRKSKRLKGCNSFPHFLKLSKIVTFKKRISKKAISFSFVSKVSTHSLSKTDFLLYFQPKIGKYSVRKVDLYKRTCYSETNMPSVSNPSLAHKRITAQKDNKVFHQWFSLLSTI